MLPLRTKKYFLVLPLSRSYEIKSFLLAITKCPSTTLPASNKLCGKEELYITLWVQKYSVRATYVVQYVLWVLPKPAITIW